MATSVTGKATEFIQFTRASNATVTDSDGKIKWAPHNLLLNSESFDAASWTKSSVTPTANSIAAPNGTTTADTLASTNSAGTFVGAYITLSFVAGHTMSVFVKAGTSNIAWISGDAGQSYGVFSLSGSGSVLTSSNGTASIASVGNSWFLITVANTTVTNSYVIVGGKDTYTSGNPWGNGTWTSGNTIYAWGAHLYRSDLGGMQANTSAYPMYNPTTPKNLLGYTEDFSNAYWQRFRSTATSNAAIAPNGLQTADKLVPQSGLTQGGLYNTAVPIISGGVYTASVYVKAAELGFAFIALNARASSTTQGVCVNLATGTLTNQGASATYSATSVGDGWWRVSCSGTAAFTSGYIEVYPLAAAGTNSSYTGDGTSGIYLWGAQLSDSASLDTYSPVYGAAVTSAAYYGPRRDFDSAGVCKGLLVEEQRTNALTYSSDFSNAVWNASSFRTLTVTTDQTTAPDGTNTADKVVEAAAGAGSVIQRVIALDTSSSAQKTFSVYAKKAERKRIYLFVNGPDDGGWFDLDLGTSGAGTDYPGGATSITPVGNGWYRCSLTPNGVSNGLVQIVVISDTATTLDTRVGDGTSGVYLWGAQLEAGSFPTSYIPTGAATATRNGDVASVSTQAFPYSATEGTWVANFQTIFSGASTGSYYLLNLDGSASKRVLYIGLGGEGISSYDGTTIVTSGTDVTGPISKSANAYTSSERAVVSNGSTVITGASVAGYATASTVNIGSTGNISGVSQLNGHIRQITYLPRRISNTELQTRTQ